MPKVHCFFQVSDFFIDIAHYTTEETGLEMTIFDYQSLPKQRDQNWSRTRVCLIPKLMFSMPTTRSSPETIRLREELFPCLSQHIAGALNIKVGPYLLKR